MKSVHPKSRAEWRRWLEKNHKRFDEIWLIYDKGGRDARPLPYADAVEEALCFGWIDGLVKPINDTQYMQRFTPRKKGSNWSAVNRKRYEEMIEAGLMTDAGLAAGPHLAKPLPVRWKHTDPLPEIVDRGLRGVARKNFDAMPRGERERYVRWIIEAKQDVTRKRRLAQAIEKLLRNERRYGPSPK